MEVSEQDGVRIKYRIIMGNIRKDVAQQHKSGGWGRERGT
jgi:hypothetical protein